MELSAPVYADSVFFEQVTVTGQLLETTGSTKVSGNTGLYHQLVNNIPAGTSYWRVKIKLKNGAILYTEIINVLTSGPQKIIFYPNPVIGNNLLNYVLQQGIPADSRLQLFDVTGRLIKDFSSIPGKINISAFPTGILIYKLIGINNTILDTGKIIIIQK
ncbi:MAG: T9SS type A sorting domain-containing protein [Bacteroidota bacterium]